MYAALSVSLWLTVVLALPAAELVVRLFIIQHDCGHGSYFRSRLANGIVGRLCSVVTFTPFANWRQLLPSAATRSAVVHRQYRISPRPSPSAAHPKLPSAGVSRGTACPCGPVQGIDAWRGFARTLFRIVGRG